MYDAEGQALCEAGWVISWDTCIPYHNASLYIIIISIITITIIICRQRILFGKGSGEWNKKWDEKSTSRKQAGR